MNSTWKPSASAWANAALEIRSQGKQNLLAQVWRRKEKTSVAFGGPSVFGGTVPALNFSVRMGRQFIVSMVGDPMMVFPGSISGVHVNRGIAEVGQVVQQLMPDLVRNLVALLDGEGGGDGDIDVGQQPVPEPPYSHVRHLDDPRHVVRRVAHLIDHLGVNAIQQARKEGLP